VVNSMVALSLVTTELPVVYAGLIVMTPGAEALSHHQGMKAALGVNSPPPSLVQVDEGLTVEVRCAIRRLSTEEEYLIDQISRCSKVRHVSSPWEGRNDSDIEPGSCGSRAHMWPKPLRPLLNLC
jgi:hypothetical protein